MTSANLLAEDRALSIRSDIRTKSLPDSPFVRRGWSRGAKVSLKQSVGDFEHLPEVTPHLLAFQARNNAGAAKVMHQARANGHRSQRIALLKYDHPAKSTTHCPLSLRLHRSDTRVNRAVELLQIQDLTRVEFGTSMSAPLDLVVRRP